MKIVLLKDVPKVGQRNDIKEVKDGFALNMLIPKGLALQATPNTIKNLENRKAHEKEVAKINIENLEKELDKIGDVKIEAKANEKGHLFAGIGEEEISKASGIPEENIVLDSPIKEVGEHKIKVRVGEKDKEIKVTISEAK